MEDYLRKKKRRKLSCCPRFNWTEPRTRLTGPTSDRSVPDSTRRFYLQPLEGKKSSLNKNIGSQRWNKTFPERIVHRWTVDGTLDESPRHPPTSKTREGPRIFFKCVQMSFDFKLAFFSLWKIFQITLNRCFFRPCASFDTDDLFCFIFCPVWNDERRRNMAGWDFFVYLLQRFLLLSLFTFVWCRCGRLDVFLRLYKRKRCWSSSFLFIETGGTVQTTSTHASSTDVYSAYTSATGSKIQWVRNTVWVRHNPVD